MLVRVN